jgi:hypothetical protein
MEIATKKRDDSSMYVREKCMSVKKRWSVIVSERKRKKKKNRWWVCHLTLTRKVIRRKSSWLKHDPFVFSSLDVHCVVV